VGEPILSRACLVTTLFCPPPALLTTDEALPLTQPLPLTQVSPEVAHAAGLTFHTLVCYHAAAVRGHAKAQCRLGAALFDAGRAVGASLTLTPQRTSLSAKDSAFLDGSVPAPAPSALRIAHSASPGRPLPRYIARASVTAAAARQERC
jgi:hypothetical protein